LRELRSLLQAKDAIIRDIESNNAKPYEQMDYLNKITLLST